MLLTDKKRSLNFPESTSMNTKIAILKLVWHALLVLDIPIIFVYSVHIPKIMGEELSLNDLQSLKGYRF